MYFDLVARTAVVAGVRDDLLLDPMPWLSPGANGDFLARSRRPHTEADSKGTIESLYQLVIRGAMLDDLIADFFEFVPSDAVGRFAIFSAGSPLSDGEVLRLVEQVEHTIVLAVN